ncbi:YHYH domain-containing protein, partial [Rhizobium ruizarguesonis]
DQKTILRGGSLLGGKTGSVPRGNQHLVNHSVALFERNLPFNQKYNSGFALHSTSGCVSAYLSVGGGLKPLATLRDRIRNLAPPVAGGAIMKIVFTILMTWSVFAVSGSGAFAHGGGTDSNGCHTNHKTGDYHCH